MMIASKPKLARITGAILVTLVFGLACDVDLIPYVTPCAIDPQCDDGVFCNGAERCVEGLCVAGDDPCDDPSRLICDEGRRMCVQCDSDAACDDGLYCNGGETCFDGACQSGVSPCVEILLECFENGVCLEESQECAAPCSRDEDCGCVYQCEEHRCVACLCIASPVVCDTGEVCDPESGICVSPDVACRINCETLPDGCLPENADSYAEVLNDWNGFPKCDDPEGGYNWHVGGVCNDGTLFVYTADIFCDLVQFFDEQTGELVARIHQGDAIDSVCKGRFFWPTLRSCENPTVTTVMCGTAYEVGEIIRLP